MTKRKYKAWQRCTMPWFPFYVNDFWRDEVVELMSGAEICKYVHLLGRSWVEFGIPSDTTKVRHLLGMSTKAFDKMWNVLKVKWVPGKGEMSQRLFNTRLETERDKQMVGWRQRVKAGKASGRARSTDVQRPFNGRGNGKPTGSQREGNESDSDSDKEEKKDKSTPAKPGGKPPSPFAEAFKAAFDAMFPKAPYQWITADFVQLAKWRKTFPTVTAEQFVRVASAFWKDGEYATALTIRQTCSKWSQLIPRYQGKIGESNEKPGDL